MRFRCHGKRIDRYRVHTTVLSGGRRGGTPLYKRNDGRRQRNVPRSLQHEQNRLKNCLCRNSPKTISSNSTHFQQSSMYKTFDHLRCFSAYSFSPLCRAARFIPRLTKTQVTPRRSNKSHHFVIQSNRRTSTCDQLLSHITFSRIKNAKEQIRTHLQTCTGLEWT